MQFDLDVEVGTNPPPVFVNIENIGPNTTVANFGSSDNGIAIATVNELSIAAGQSALLQVNILTSFNPRGRYRDSIPVWEQDPTKQAAPTYNVEFNFNLFQPGPASIVGFSHSANPIEILPDGIALAEGSYLALLIDVSGTPPIEYVWQFSTDNDIWQPVQDGPEVFGLGEDTLGFEFMSIARSGYYRCAVSNDGIGGDTSSAFFVRVDPQPPMITQPESISVFEGATASFHVTAESYSPVFYQWRFAADGFIFRDLTSSDVGIAAG